MSANEIIAELPKLERRELERVDARLHQLLDKVKSDAAASQKPIGQTSLEFAEADEPLSDQTHVGLEDFPQFPNLHLTQEYVGRDVIYDARGR